MQEDHVASSLWSQPGKRHHKTAWIWSDVEQSAKLCAMIENTCFSTPRAAGCRCLSYQDLDNAIFAKRSRDQVPVAQDFLGWGSLYDWKNTENDR
jgi:hypothetical protein